MLAPRIVIAGSVERPVYPPATIQLFTKWALEHDANPKPFREEIMEMMHQTGLEYDQGFRSK